jgi:hypothetical protein
MHDREISDICQALPIVLWQAMKTSCHDVTSTHNQLGDYLARPPSSPALLINMMHWSKLRMHLWQGF